MTSPAPSTPTTPATPLPPTPTTPPLDHPHDRALELQWAAIRRRLSAILQNISSSDHPVRVGPDDWVSMYTQVAHLYDQNDDGRKRRMFRYVRRFIQDLVDDQLLHLRTFSGVPLLAEYNRRWTTSLRFVRFMKRVLHHLHPWIRDNENSLKQNPIRPIDKLFMFYWREDLLTHLHSLVDIALFLVQKDRSDKIPDNDRSSKRHLTRGLVDNLVLLGSADIYTPPPSPKSDGRISLDPEPAHEVHCHSKMHLYQQLFEEPYLAATVNFYKTHGNERLDLQTQNVSCFMKRILARLEREEALARVILHSNSVSRVRQAAEEQLIGNQVEDLQKKVNAMIFMNETEDLHVVYNLLRRVEDGLVPVRSHFVQQVRTEGNSVVVSHVSALQGKENIRHNLKLIEKLLKLYMKYAKLVRKCFDGSSMFLLAIDDAFRGFINRSVGSISLPNLLAHHVDHLLRDAPSSGSSILANNEKSVISNRTDTSDDETRDEVSDDAANEPRRKRQKTEDAVVQKDEKVEYLNELVRFFMYLDDKDVFCETYRRLFAKRLLSSDADEDLETEFITRLESKMGGIYTQRFRGMLQDVRTSETLRQGFWKFVDTKRGNGKESSEIADVTVEVGKEGKEGKCEEGDGNGRVVEVNDEMVKLDMSAFVLNALHWPTGNVVKVKVPAAIKAAEQLFHEYYMQNRESRTLTWAYGMATMTLSGRYRKKTYYVSTSCVQGCILLLFNAEGEKSVEEIGEELMLSAEEVWKEIRPLLYGRRSKLLQEREEEGCGSKGAKKEWTGKRIGVNEAFASGSVKVNVPSMGTEERNEVGVGSRQHVVEDRNTQVDAAVIRVMKAKKEVTHVELCTEVIRTLSQIFVPDPRLIKLRIERLIDLEYMSRDEADVRVYRYNA